MHADGHGTITVKARFGNRITHLRLQNVLYVPTNKYNLFALGKWDSNGQMYQGHTGKLILYNKD